MLARCQTASNTRWAQHQPSESRRSERAAVKARTSRGGAGRSGEEGPAGGSGAPAPGSSLQETPPATSSGEKDLRDPGGRTGISRRVIVRPRSRTTPLGTILQRDHAAARASQHRQPLRSARASAPDVRTCFCPGRSEAFAVRSTWQRTRSGSRRRIGGQSYTRSSTVVAKGTRAPAGSAVLLVAVLRREGKSNAC